MEFRKSTRKNKKYDVKVGDKWISFGSSNHEHYKDSTPLKLYSHLDHLDEKRRDNFKKRFQKLYDKNNKNSAIYWSWNYLW